MQQRDTHEECGQCSFAYARIDTEGWGEGSSRRVMCPICGWTKFEEHHWEDNAVKLVKRSESQGFGAYRLIPPGGYSGYNAFHSAPGKEVVNHIIELLGQKGWKGYLTTWDSDANRARLLVGSPLQKFDVMEKAGQS